MTPTVSLQAACSGGARGQITFERAKPYYAMDEESFIDKADDQLTDDFIKDIHHFV